MAEGSIYAQAMQIGFQSIGTMFDNTQKKIAWNESYDQWSQVLAARKTAESAINANELGLSQLGQEKILSNMRIRLAQDDAVAQAKISAATAGVQGGSVEAVKHQTEVNEGLAIGFDNYEFAQRKGEYVDRAKQLRYNIESIPKVRKRIYKNKLLSTAATMSGIIGSQEFMNRVINAWDSWKPQSDNSGNGSQLDGNDYGGRHGEGGNGE